MQTLEAGYIYIPVGSPTFARSNLYNLETVEVILCPSSPFQPKGGFFGLFHDFKELEHQNQCISVLPRPSFSRELEFTHSSEYLFSIPL